MNTRSMPVTPILVLAVGLGVAGDLLLRAPGAPGLNFTLLLGGMAASLAFVSLRSGRGMSLEAWALVAAAVLSGTGLLWRGSEFLRFLAFVAAAGAFALVALHAGRAWVRRAGVADLIEAVIASGAHAAFGPFRLFRRGGWERASPDEPQPRGWRIARSVVVGLLVAAVPLFVFGALFMSADPVFAGIIENLVRVDLETFASHVGLTVVLTWLACGYLTGFWSGTRLGPIRMLMPARPSLRPAEIATAVGLVDLLFLAFVLVQLRYLFGGAAWVEVTPGVTYAAYAREGFFQLVVATALGLPWLLAADALLGEREGPGTRVFRALAGAQLLLLVAIVASAVQRMRAYLDAYGLTESRFVATAVLLWLALLVLWFAATVLRGRRSGFAFGALASAYVLVAALHVANPAVHAARSQLDRAAAEVAHPASFDPTSVSGPRGASGSEGGVDAVYLASLGSDATPIVLQRLDELDDKGRCQVARRLLSRWGPERDRDWRAWNAADWRARRLVEADADRLREMAEEGRGCE